MKTVPFTSQEKYALVAHMLTNITPKDHAEGMKFYDVFKECNLSSTKKIIVSKEASKLGIDDLDGETQINESLSSGTVEYLLEILNKPMNGFQSLVLVPVSIRLRAIQLDQYKG